MPKIDIDKLKRLRTAIPLTQPELAEKMGMKRSTYAYKEKIGEFTETEILELVRIFQIKREDIVISEETNGNGSNSHKNSPANHTGPPVEEIIKAKDQTIDALNRALNFVEEENKRLKTQCEVNLAGLNRYAQIVNARVQAMLECHTLLRAAALQAKVDKKKIDESEVEIRKLYVQILRETVEGELNQK